MRKMETSEWQNYQITLYVSEAHTLEKLYYQLGKFLI